MKKWLGMILSVVFLASCAEMDEPREMLGENEEIVGTWVEESLEDQVTTMKRAENLAQDRYGFIIREDGTFVERKNAGWCGTPPISYDNFEGTWEALSDSLLDITVGYWGGTMTYQMRIVSLDKEYLRIRYLYGDNRADNK
ncbi:MAG TPA: hypothetical protein ENO05_10790 [Bacteroides sp.]|nr:hypothetical protein [Bacteroides sp.]